MAHSVEMDRSRARGAAMFYELLRAMRPKDWIKNVFVFAALVFSADREWKQPDRVLLVVAAFVLFSMVASSIYLINDLVDIEKDRAHPKKRYRPLASGKLSPKVAIVAAIVLLGTALPMAFVIDMKPDHTLWQNVNFGLTLIIYLVVQGILYSYFLKHMVILDIFTIAAGFVLRAVAGAQILDINITPWLLICMGLLALFLGSAKRRAELVLLQEGAGEHRRILDEYSLPMLDQMMSIITAATLIAYTLFTTLGSSVAHNNALNTQTVPPMMLTVPFVVYAIFRYLYLIYRHGGGGNPADLLIGDRPFAISIVLWGLTVLAILAVG